MSLKVGLDFGTSNSGVAVCRDGQVVMLPVDPQNVMPEVAKSILYITKDFRHYIGQEAVELYYKHYVNRQRRFVRKWIGEIDVRGGDMYFVRDVYMDVDELIPGRLLQFIKTTLRSTDYKGTMVFDRFYTTTDLIGIYLRELKIRAEALLGEEIGGVTLGRPVRFLKDPTRDQQAEDALRQAASEAGFKQIDFELEPVAAALYYEKSLDRPQNVLIFDFGGGTLDITIIRLGDQRRRKIFASGGIGIAGGDFDRAIIQKRMLPYFGQGKVSTPEIIELIDAVADWIALPDLSTPLARGRLQEAILAGKAPARLKALQALVFNDLAFSFYSGVESAKISLSSQDVTLISLKERDIDLWELYTRSQFENDILEYRERIEQVLMECISASGLEPGQIDAVVKTGGSSGIPLFTQMLWQIFGRERVRTADVFNSVTAGLAIKAASGA